MRMLKAFICFAVKNSKICSYYWITNKVMSMVYIYVVLLSANEVNLSSAHSPTALICKCISVAQPLLMHGGLAKARPAYISRVGIRQLYAGVMPLSCSPSTRLQAHVLCLRNGACLNLPQCSQGHWDPYHHTGSPRQAY